MLRVFLAVLLAVGLMFAGVGCDKGDDKKVDTDKAQGEVDEAKDKADQERTSTSLSILAKAANMWLLRFGNDVYYPRSLEDLLKSGMISDPKVFIHPVRGSELVEDKFVCDYDSAFDRAGFNMSEAGYPAECMVAWERQPRFKGGRVVVYIDARTELISDEKFEEELKKLDEAIKGREFRLRLDAFGQR